MNRYKLVALMLVLAPAFARGNPPRPAADCPPAAKPCGPAYCNPVLAPPVIGQPLPVCPTVPCPPEACGPCEKRPGFLRQVMGWFGGRTATACSGTSCPTPRAAVVTAATPVRAAAHGGPCWDRLKAWLCWKPCREQFLPVLVPEPYQAPVSAYFRTCQEPTAVPPCAAVGHAKGKKKACDTGSCPPAACTVAVGPVVPQRTYAVNGWTPMYAGPAAAPAAPSAVVPAAATVKPAAANPIARPFTSP